MITIYLHNLDLKAQLFFLPLVDNYGLYDEQYFSWGVNIYQPLDIQTTTP